MASQRPHLNVRLTDEWQERFRALVRRAQQQLNIPTLSQSDVVLMGLSLVEKWLHRLEALEREQDEPTVPGDAGTEKRGRPRKGPAGREAAGGAGS